MRSETTDEERAQFRTDGFTVITDLLSSAELEHWRAVVDRALQARAGRMPGSAEEYPGWFDAPVDQYYEKVFTQRLNLWLSDAEARALVLDPRLGKLAAQLGAVDGVRIWQDQALVKEPYSNPTGYHLDVPYWSFDSRDALTIWVALDDATVENGCLCYLPGTHKVATFDNVAIGNDVGSLFAIYPSWTDIVPVFCPVPAGSAVVHNGLTAHGAGANMTSRRRRAMTIAYMPDGSTFNGKTNVLPRRLVERLKEGDLLDDPEQNPLVFSGSASVS